MRGVKLDSAQNVALRAATARARRTSRASSSATRQLTMPFWSTWACPSDVAGIDSVDKLGQFDLNAVSPDYFATMGTRIVARPRDHRRGRDGAPRVDGREPEHGARRCGRTQDAIGQCMRVSADTMPCTYVVGIAEDIKSQQLERSTRASTTTCSAAQFQSEQGGLFVRVAASKRSMTKPLRQRCSTRCRARRTSRSRRCTTVVGAADAVMATRRHDVRRCSAGWRSCSRRSASTA